MKKWIEKISCKDTLILLTTFLIYFYFGFLPLRSKVWIELLDLSNSLKYFIPSESILLLSRFKVWIESLDLSDSLKYFIQCIQNVSDDILPNGTIVYLFDNLRGSKTNPIFIGPFLVKTFLEKSNHMYPHFKRKRTKTKLPFAISQSRW